MSNLKFSQWFETKGEEETHRFDSSNIQTTGSEIGGKKKMYFAVSKVLKGLKPLLRQFRE